MTQINEEKMNTKIENIIKNCKLNINYLKEVKCDDLTIEYCDVSISEVTCIFQQCKHNTYYKAVDEYLKTYVKLLTDTYSASNLSVQLFEEIESTSVINNIHVKYTGIVDEILLYTETSHISIKDTIEKARMILCDKCNLELSICSIKNETNNLLLKELISSHETLNWMEDFQLETNYKILINTLINTYETIQMLFETLSLLETHYYNVII
jgi:hypothetical protein